MTSYTVLRDQPQAITSDGWDTPVSIYNKGPWTVFIDSVSSVSNQSYALLPSDTYVWDAGLPLWVRGNDSNAVFVSTGHTRDPSLYNPSTLIVTPNHSPSASKNNTKVVLPLVSFDIGDTNPPSSNYRYYPIETSAFESLTLVMRSINSYQLYAYNASWHMQVRWFDATGKQIAADFYMASNLFRNDAGERVPGSYTFDVKGDYCIIFPTHGGSNLDPRIQYDVYGSTQKLAPRSDWQIERHRNLTTAVGGGQYSPFTMDPTAAAGTIGYTGDTAYIDAWNYTSPIYLNVPKRRVTITAMATGITTAGVLELSLEAALNSGTMEGTILRMEIPTGVTTVSGTAILPLTQPTSINGRAIVGGSIDLTIVWSD